jgi:hypothetical protein
MTDAPVTPPGWYADPAGSPLQRWWDGTAWTDHVHDPAAAAPGFAGTNPTTPVGTSPFTVWIWVFAITPLLGLFSLVFQQDVSYSSYTSTTATTAQDLQDLYASIFTPEYLMQLAISFLLYAAAVLIAFFDWRELKSRGVEKPFHWAFAFIPWQLVYAIGRAVVAARRTGSGWSPMVAYICAGVLVFIVSFVYGIGLAMQDLSSIY